MIHYKIGRTDGVDFLWIAAESTHGISHCGKVDDGWHATDAQTV